MKRVVIVLAGVVILAGCTPQREETYQPVPVAPAPAPAPTYQQQPYVQQPYPGYQAQPTQQQQQQKYRNPNQPYTIQP